MGVLVLLGLGLVAGVFASGSGSNFKSLPARSGKVPEGFVLVEGQGVAELMPVYAAPQPSAADGSGADGSCLFKGCPPGMVCKKITYPNGSSYGVCVSSGGSGGAGSITDELKAPRPPGIEPKGDASGSCCESCARGGGCSR